MGLCLPGPRVPPSMTATQLRNLVKITMVRKATSYEPYVSRRNFCLHSQRPHAFFLTAASQCFQLATVANFPTSLSLYSCVTIGRKSSVHSACCTLLRMLSKQLWIWCSAKFWSFDGLPNLMLKWIWCGSEGSYDDFYLKVVTMIYTWESKAQLWPILFCVIRGHFA